MRKPALSRRFIALVAAYVVALQVLLLPLSVAAQAIIPSGLCAHSGIAEGSQPPASHETGCPCAAGCGTQCCGQALIGPPPVEIVLVLTQARALTPAPVVKPNVRPLDKGPQLPRAPPAA